MPENEEIYIEYQPLSALRRWPRNPKEHDLGEIHTSLNRFGYVNPIIIDERTGQMVVGHGRIDTLDQQKAAGKQPPKRIKVIDGEWYAPVVRGVEFNSDQEAEAYGIADNRLVELGGWENTQLVDILSELANEDALDGIGFDGDDLDNLIRQLQPIEDLLDPANLPDPIHKRFEPSGVTVIGFGGFVHALKGELGEEEVQALTVKYASEAAAEDKEALAYEMGEIFWHKLRAWAEAHST